jgi:16S rRNA (uracil1498-N3)-methyltransferase
VPPGGPDPVLVSASAMVFVDDVAAPMVDRGTLHHLVDVLRIRPDELVVASDGAGSWVRCRLSGSGPGSLVVEGTVTVRPPPDPVITVAFVPTKGDRPEWVTQKLTELGVDRIVPLWSHRSVVRWQGERGDRSVDRLRRVAREASAQCRRTRLPEVTGVMGLEELAVFLGAEPCLAQPGGGPPGLDRAVVAVGPEGGWDDEELARWGPGVGLGPTVLRSETAAVAAGTLLCALRGGVVGPLA